MCHDYVGKRNPICAKIKTQNNKQYTHIQLEWFKPTTKDLWCEKWHFPSAPTASYGHIFTEDTFPSFYTYILSAWLNGISYPRADEGHLTQWLFRRTVRISVLNMVMTANKENNLCFFLTQGRQCVTVKKKRVVCGMFGNEFLNGPPSKYFLNNKHFNLHNILVCIQMQILNALCYLLCEYQKQWQVWKHIIFATPDIF